MRAALFVAAALLASSARAQDLAIVHGRVLSMGPAGEIADGTVLVHDGRIAAVGPASQVRLPPGVTVVDAQSGVVTPGLIATDTPLGVVEVSEGVEETDDDSTASDKLSAAFDVQYALNPQSILLPIVRLGGVTDAVVTPSMPGGPDRKGLIFAGQAAVIQIGRGDRLLEKPHAGMVLQMGEDGARRAGGSRAAEFGLLKAMLEDVRTYAANRSAYDRNQSRALALSREDLEALIPVVEGREPLVAIVHRKADILQMLDLAREERLHLILEGAEEAWLAAPEIAAAHVPVLLSAFQDLPSSFDALASSLENAARLNAAGVLVGIEQPPLYQGGRTPRIDAGRAAAHGLPKAAALAAITINSARIYGVADRIGSLEPGKDADVVVWSGDPLEPMSAPTHVVIKGLEQPLRDRDLDLRDRYLRQSAYPPQYVTP